MNEETRLDPEEQEALQGFEEAEQLLKAMLEKAPVKPLPTWVKFDTKFYFKEYQTLKTLMPALDFPNITIDGFENLKFHDEFVKSSIYGIFSQASPDVLPKFEVYYTTGAYNVQVIRDGVANIVIPDNYLGVIELTDENIEALTPIFENEFELYTTASLANYQNTLAKSFKTALTKIKTERDKKIAFEAKVTSLQESLKLVYKEEDFEFSSLKANEYSPCTETKYRIALKFSNFTITNGNKSSRKIGELFIVLYLNKDLQLSHSSMFGFKRNAYADEYISGYRHSHLPQRRDNEFFMPSVFCTGSTDLTALLGDLRLKTFSAERYTQLFIMLLGYVQWESIEGGPYMQIKDSFLRNRNSSSGFSRVTPGEVTEVLKYHNTLQLIKDKIALTYQETGIFGKFSVDFSSTELYPVLRQLLHSSKFCLVDSSGVEHPINANNTINPRVIQHSMTAAYRNAAESRRLLQFKEEDMSPKLLEEEDQEQIQLSAPVLTRANREIFEKVFSQEFSKWFINFKN